MTSSRGARRWWIAGGLVVAGLLTSGCSADDLPRFGWPKTTTDQGDRMVHFWSWTVISALSVGIIVWGLMFWSFIMYRKRKNGPLYPKQTKENLPLELTYTAIPLVMVSVLFYFTATTENYVQQKVANPDVVVDVTAQKWTWDFGYEGTKVPGAAAGEVLPGVAADEVHTVGTSDEVPILVVPSGKVIEFHLASKDVIHSFWVPDFAFKRDVFPDPVANGTDNVFQVTIKAPGAMVGRCAELCGTYHSAMNFEVRAVPDNIYQAYLKARQSVDPATKQPFTAAAALTEVGKANSSCGQLCAPLSYTTYPINPDRTAKAASEPGGN